MKWQEAIVQSKKGTAMRIVNEEPSGGLKMTVLAYSDGSGYILFSKNNKVIFDKSHPTSAGELDQYEDWEPSI
jgi:hypothetical protein